MPTIEQLADWCRAEIAKGKGSCHTQHPVIMEEVRAQAIENKPDDHGRQRTRIAFETYSAKSYSLWNELLEGLMEQLGCNPILVVDLIATLIRLAGDEGIEMAKDNLCKLNDYEQELREARAAKKRRKKAK